MFNIVDHLLPPFSQIDEQTVDLPARRQLRFDCTVRKIILLLEGDCFVTLDEQPRWRMKAGDILLVDRVCQHAYAPANPARSCRLHLVRLVFDPKKLPPLVHGERTRRRTGGTTRSLAGFIRLHLSGSEILPGAVTPEIRECLARIRLEAEERGAGYLMAIGALCLTLLTAIARQRTPSLRAVAIEPTRRRPANVVQLSKAYITANLSKPIRLQEVAWHVGWSEEHFCRVFRAMTGQPPAQYIRHARIEQAKNRLLGTSDSVAQIAAKTGFTSPAVFSRCFRREIGKSPQEYRDRERVGEVKEDVSADYRPVR